MNGVNKLAICTKYEYANTDVDKRTVARKITWHLVQTRSVHQDWDPAGHNKKVRCVGGILHSLGEMLDMKRSGQKKDRVH